MAVLKRQADIQWHLVTLAGNTGHLAKLGRAGYVAVGQCAVGIRQKLRQRLAQGLIGRAVEQGGGGRIENNDALVLVNTDDGIK